MQTAWGGSIVEVSLNGENFVNAHDAGREVQLAQFDPTISTGTQPKVVTSITTAARSSPRP